LKFSLSWLKEHIDLKSNLEINTIVNSLTSLGLEVESFNNHAEKLTDFIVAEVLEVKQHPNADRLNICKVNNGKNILEVVCGAKNVKKSLKVVLAPIGSTIPVSGLMLKKKEIRGFIGEGMICSAEELGLEDKSEGILELPAKTKIGKSLADLKQYSDVIFEIGLTPNRGDCASVMGIARELAALGLGTIKEKKKKVIKSSFKSSVKWKIDLEEKNEKACSFVTGRYFKGLQNRESPEWLKNRLISIGLRPISCLVDLTNYITFDLGRPLHVFDAKKIKGDLSIRMARDKEKIKALDGKDYVLNSNMLVISDEKTVVSLAGVIGGENSSCDFNTSEMFLESALFDPLYISNTGRKLNILSDARYRFERGVDPSYVEEGLNIMTELVLELCGGEVSDIVKSGFIKTDTNFIDYNCNKVNQLSGLTITSKDQQDLLHKLGFDVKVNKNNFKIKPPTWRHDIVNEIDIVEEIIRLNGYDNIQEFELPYYYSNKPILNISEVRNRLIRNSLVKRGLFESVTFSFLSEKDNKLYSDKDTFMELDNPISEDLSIMRTSLIPNIVNNFLTNINKGLKNIGLFEVGAIYLGDEIGDQYNSAAGIRAGLAGNRNWSDNTRNVDLYDAKKDVYSSLSVLGVNLNNITIKLASPSWYHPGRSGSINLGKTILGYFGELHPSLTKKYGIRIVAFEIFPDSLPKSFKAKKNKEYKQYNLMPIKRDFSFYINSEIHSVEIENTIKSTLQNNALVKLIEINIFDLYEDTSSGKTRISIALEIILQPIENTLNENEIKVISDLIIEKVQEKNNALLKD
jgi:phenylalanyl-tRNA synthetase beta chain